MPFKKLEKFQGVFEQEEFSDGFNYISNHKKINKIKKIISAEISTPSSSDNLPKKVLEEYLKNLEEFYTCLCERYKPVNDLKEGYSLICQELERALDLLSVSDKKRREISKGYRRKFRKNFLKGLRRLNTGIDDFLKLGGSVAFGNNFFSNYLIDDKAGFGDEYMFHKPVIKKIRNNEFNNTAENQFLKNLRKRHKIRDIDSKKGNWKKYGDGGDRYRAYICKFKFGEKRVYFFIHNNDEEKKKIDYKIKNNKIPNFKKASKS